MVDKLKTGITIGVKSSAKTTPSTSPQKGGGNKEEFKGNIQRKTGIMVTPNSIIRKRDFQHTSSAKDGVAQNIKTNVQNSLNRENDSGSSALSTGISTGTVSIKTFKAAQNASPYVADATKKTIKVVRTIDRSIGLYRSGVMQIDQRTISQLKSKAVKHIMNTQPMVKLNNAVSGVKTAVQTTKRYSTKVGQGTVKAVKITRGVLKGKYKVNISKQSLQNFNKVSVSGLKTTATHASVLVKRGAAKGSGAIKLGGKGVTQGLVSFGDYLSNSEDMGSQSLGTGIKSSHLTIKTTPKVLKYGGRQIKTGVSNTIKTSRTVYRAGLSVSNFARSFGRLGAREALQFYQANLARSIASAGGSIVNVGLQGLRTIGLKVALPLMIIIFVVITIVNTTSAPVSGIATIFSGSFTVKDTKIDYEVHTFLEGVISSKRQSFINELLRMRDRNLVSNGGAYHYVKFFTETNTQEISMTESNISNVIYTQSEFVSLIEPMFQVIILSEYDLEPSQNQVERTINDIWNKLIHVETEELEPIINTYEVELDDGTIEEYEEVLRVLGITIRLDGYYELLTKYFTDPIDQLANMSNRTSDQEDKLQSLKDNYELALAYMEIVLENIDSSESDISGVNFINGSRPNNDAIIKIAEMQLGNVGGKPYWSWYGFKGRVEWCAVFVSWLSNQMGYIDSGKVPKFSYVPNGIQWFKNKGQWAAGNYQYPIAGDIIFFDWQGDGVSDHVGIVVGNDGYKVYTIEGNSGDVARRRSYPLNSRVISGYGLPNY